MLRWYQERAIDMTRSAIKKKDDRVILCMGTGSGKTYTASHIAKMSSAKGKRVSIMVNRVEILEQFFKSLVSVGVTPNIVHGRDRAGNGVNLCMVKTYMRRHKLMGLQEDLVIVDEAHHGDFKEFLERCRCAVIGLTATPVSSSPGYDLRKHFRDIVCPVDTRQLIKEGHLVPAKTYSLNHDFSHIKKSGADFNAKDLVEEFRSAPRLRKGALENYQKICPGEKAICYNVNVEESLRYLEIFNEAGFKGRHVDGRTPEAERKEIFKEFHEGRFDILHNVGVATTGYDEPSVKCIIENFATTSLSKHHQCIGRGARPYPGKDEFFIIDMGANYRRHGQFGDEVRWDSIFKSPKMSQNKKNDAKKMECEECGAIIDIVSECPYCKNWIPEDRIEEMEEELMTAAEIKQRKLDNMPEEIRGKPLGAMTRKELMIYAKAMGNSTQWVNIRMSKRRWR